MNILQKVYRKISCTINRKRLKNKNFTILAPTCIAGVIYHNLGQKFLSPTINLFMTEEDFFKFVNDLKWYIEQDVIEIDSNKDFPVGMIIGRKKEDNIVINFNHYKNFDEARNKWNERKKRINYDNIFIIMSDRSNEVSYKYVEQLGKLRKIAKGLCFFTSKEYDFEYTLQLKKYKNEQHVKSYMINDISPILHKLVWEDEFDYVYWLNTGKVKKYNGK